MKIAFVLNDLRLSGGVNVVLQYASRLASSHRDEIFLLLREETTDDWWKPLVDNGVAILSEDWDKCEFDVAIATYWETLLLLGQVRAKAFLWFCQLYEDRFFPDRNPNISTMQIAGSIPLPVVTEAHWLKDLFLSENPDRHVEVVLNGVDKAIFSEEKSAHDPGSGFKVLIEGSLDAIAKNTAFAIRGSLRSRSATRVTHVGNRPLDTEDPRYHFIESGLSFNQMANLYRSHHVQVKTPLAEGMFGPPLEGFHCGLPAIVTPVTGAEEYIEDRVNALIVLWDDSPGLGQAIDTLATNEKLWRQLQNGARRTAESWPDWDSQTLRFRESIIRLSESSKLTQSDLGNLGRNIQFAGLIHWLAIRRLSDKSAGPRVMEQLLYGSRTSSENLLGKIKRKLNLKAKKQ